MKPWRENTNRSCGAFWTARARPSTRSTRKVCCKWCNKGVAGMGGYAPEELIGRHYLQWAHPDNREELEQR
ncbi:MAG: PAS domain-containing protein [Pyrinomonadaceae bacterium]